MLVDLGAPDEESVRRIKEHAPGCGLLLLVQYYAQDEIVELLKAGASGFICSDESVGSLARSVIAVARGEIVLPQALAAGTLAALARGGDPPAPLLEHLSDREAEVLRLLARGLTNKDIAQSLVISVRTVEAHLRSIYGKLEMRSRTEAALWAIRHGYGSESPAKGT